MDRATFKRLADLRLREARQLLQRREWSGAYYLAGYAVECGLKAVAVQQFRGGRLPDKQLVRNIYTHDLEQLVGVAGLGPALKRAQASPLFVINWALTKDWSEAARYTTWRKVDAVDLVTAIADPAEGVLPWLKSNW